MKVLVPVEDIFFGSALANFIIQHQWPENTEFRIVSVMDPYLFEHFSRSTLAKFMETSEEKVVTTIKQTVQEIAEIIEQNFPKLTVSQRVMKGHIKDEIISAAKEWSADLIIGGSHGKSGFNRLLLGSISLTLVAEAPCPVLLIKPSAKILKAWEKFDYQAISVHSLMDEFAVENRSTEKQKILVTIDETKFSEQVVDFIIQHKWTQSAHFKLLGVTRQPSWVALLQVPELAEIYQDFLQTRKTTLKNLALKLAANYPSSFIEEELIEGEPKRTIIEIAKQWGANLIVVGYNTQSTTEKHFIGSISLAVLCAAPCPVLLLRPKSKESERKSAEDQNQINLSNTTCQSS